ncbi:3'(2'),5'-bisphosphate nucleotidase CysQ [Halomonas sp. E19]|uniref:3'(2'),5'-bisphosphate nucleotidase CysQ n=1 Tax=unclassified Halomonas TaxID=2609666 RepID=UPI004033F85C
MPLNLTFIEALRSLCETAGREILAVRRRDSGWLAKDDGSPVTQADLAAQRCLVEGLPALLDLPLLSEEARLPAWALRQQWQRYWLVDPLDGTREFIEGYEDFTVNVALIEEGRVVLGLVHAPALGSTWGGGVGLGAWCWRDNRRREICVSPGWPLRILASRAHLDAQTQEWIAGYPDALLERCGSSVKFCRIAEGEADLYPRFGPTCEWDTAAGQGVLEGAGGVVLDIATQQPVRYNRGESLVNGPFLACSAGSLSVPPGSACP